MNGEVGRGGKRRDNISRRETSSRWSKFLDLYLYMKRTCGSTVTTNRAAAMAEWLNWASETKRINIERYCMHVNSYTKFQTATAALFQQEQSLGNKTQQKMWPHKPGKATYL